LLCLVVVRMQVMVVCMDGELGPILLTPTLQIFVSICPPYLMDDNKLKTVWKEQMKAIRGLRSIIC